MKWNVEESYPDYEKLFKIGLYLAGLPNSKAWVTPLECVVIKNHFCFLKEKQEVARIHRNCVDKISYQRTMQDVEKDFQLTIAWTNYKGQGQVTVFRVIGPNAEREIIDVKNNFDNFVKEKRELTASEKAEEEKLEIQNKENISSISSTTKKGSLIIASVLLFVTLMIIYLTSLHK